MTASVIRAMEEMGILAVEEQRAYRNPLGEMKRERKRLVLNEEQRQAVERINWSYRSPLDILELRIETRSPNR